VTWQDGWPLVGEVKLEVADLPWPLTPAPAPPAREDFDTPELLPHWISLRDRPAERVTTKERDGWLTLRARGGSLDSIDAVFVGHRQQHLAFAARTLIDAGAGVGGLAVRLDERHHYAVQAAPDGTVRVLARIGSLHTVVAQLTTPPGPLVLTVRTDGAPLPHDSRKGPDSLVFGVEAADGTLTEAPPLDGRYLSTEVAGGFTGRVVGVYAAEGTVCFDWFDYHPAGDGTGAAP
ncbi:glycoside hydrolase family 43 protein, partial [Streptacidiphilus monticola]